MELNIATVWKVSIGRATSQDFYVLASCADKAIDIAVERKSEGNRDAHYDRQDVHMVSRIIEFVSYDLQAEGAK